MQQSARTRTQSNRMTSPPVQALLEFASEPAVGIRELGQCLELTIDRAEARILVTVPREVLEWFVDATCVATSRKVSDWCDYRGYDDTPEEELAVEMARDVRAFVRALIERPLRFREQRRLLRRKLVLEWQHDGRWSSAVPLDGEWGAA
jgi:hypothetical protein